MDCVSSSVNFDLGAAYTLWMYKRVVLVVILQPVKDADLSSRDVDIISTSFDGTFGWFVACAVNDMMHPSINSLVEHLSRSKL